MEDDVFIMPQMAALIQKDYEWRNGVVPYYFKEGQYSKCDHYYNNSAQTYQKRLTLYVVNQKQQRFSPL